MRMRTLAVLAAAATLAGCSSSVESAEAAQALAFCAASTPMAGAQDQGAYMDRLVDTAPDELQDAARTLQRETELYNSGQSITPDLDAMVEAGNSINDWRDQHCS